MKTMSRGARIPALIFSIVATILALIGLAGVPGDIQTWAKWLAPLGSWAGLVIIAVGVCVGGWAVWSLMKGEKTQPPSAAVATRRGGRTGIDLADDSYADVSQTKIRNQDTGIRARQSEVHLKKTDIG